MAIRVKSKALGRLLCMVGVLTVVGSFASTVQAQEPESVLDAVENISERRSGDYFSNRSFGGQFSFLTGLGGFSEQRLNRDSAAMSGAVEELWILQTQNTATVRVPDLPNPYTTSVQLLPASQFNSRVVGSELNFEPLPRR
ncbi:MAG: hypothetical protein AAF810_01220 [Cyanobacteria bacterium P01_D01_bin.36]